MRIRCSWRVRTHADDAQVEPTDPEAVANALVTLLTDRPLWEACRKSGLEHIHEYSWSAHCQRYVAVLDETIKTHGSAKPQGSELLAATGAPEELLSGPHAQRMLVVSMCSRDTREAARLLQRALDTITSQGARLDTVAVVVASVLSTQQTLSILDKAGVLQGSLHAVVADAGATILTHTAKRQDLVANEAWEAHISFRWLVRCCSAVLRCCS